MGREAREYDYWRRFIPEKDQSERAGNCRLCCIWLTTWNDLAIHSYGIPLPNTTLCIINLELGVSLYYTK